MASVFALVVAAGQGSRFGGPVPKQYRPLGSTILVRHAVAALARHPLIANVLVAIRPEDKASFDHAVAGLPVMPPVAGGTTRQDSVRLGLEALAAYRPERVLIHDGARPFPDPGLVEPGVDRLPPTVAAVPYLPVPRTITRAAARR